MTLTTLAQRVAFNHPLTNSEQQTAALRMVQHSTVSVPDTVHILAVMVQFQTDKDDRTTGTGEFDLSAPTKIIDPAPHNKTYFDRHIAFVQNYFRRVSKGKLIVVGDVLDTIYRLPNKMQTYSPPRGSTNNAELGSMVADTWKLVDSVTPGIQYEKYQCFVIFHAGVGHDIDFVSLYGYDPAAYDIPSIYFGLPGLQKIYGGSYQGIPVRNGSYHITNSLVLPETENRLISGTTGNFLLQLGINGLFAASLGSYLGLPDLFDTKTGSSGIGRFGLMDGQAIFSWDGVFPPEPSAWERDFLGWTTTIPISSGSSIYTLPAASLNGSADTIYKILISDKEFFLVENRDRDANRDSAIIWIARDTGTVRLTWARDTTKGFNAYDQDSLWGVITDVDEFDWSLPGGVNSAGRWFEGGILIWHIDQNVIDQTIATDAINANSSRKGVNLMEADGSQDIGQSYGTLSAGSGSEDGTPFDFWYRGNSAPLRATSNEFTPVSYPGSKSNDGANSHIYIRQFSKPGPIMTAQIQVGDTIVAPLAGFPKSIGGAAGNHSVKVASLNGKTSLLIGNAGILYGWQVDGSPILSTLPASGVLANMLQSNVSADVLGDPVVGDFNSNGVPDVAFLDTELLTTGGTRSYNLRAYSVSDSNSNGLIDPQFARSSVTVTAPLAATDSYLAWGDSGVVRFFRLSDDSLMSYGSLSNNFGNVIGVTSMSKSSANSFVSVTMDGLLSVLMPGVLPIVANPSRQLNSFVPAPAIVGYLSSAQNKRIIYASGTGSLYVLDSLLNKVQGFPVSFPVSFSGSVVSSPALADVDGDGVRDIVMFGGNEIYAVNSSGAVLDHFPITTPTKQNILTAPVVADVDGDGHADIVAVTQEGLVLAYDRNGKMLEGFPLFAGTNSGSTPAVVTYNPQPGCLTCSSSIVLAVAADDGKIYAWKTGSLSSSASWNAPWPQKMRDAQNSNYEDSYIAPVTKTKGFFPASSAYNWPNPVGKVQGYQTHIRYYLGAAAAVTIKIFDMAGELVKEIDTQGQGGMDNEVLWDVSGIQSGVYFAHIEAQGGGEQGSTIIKIAVIK
jgi:hypothetical protein